MTCTASNANDMCWWPDLKAAIDYGFHYPDGELRVTKGQDYVVYGLLPTSLCTWAFICPSSSDVYSYLYPMPLFKVLSWEHHPEWTVGSATRHFAFPGRDPLSIISYRELATDLDHYEGLVEGWPGARKRFAQYRREVEQWERSRDV